MKFWRDIRVRDIELGVISLYVIEVEWTKWLGVGIGSKESNG